MHAPSTDCRTRTNVVSRYLELSCLERTYAPQRCLLSRALCDPCLSHVAPVVVAWARCPMAVWSDDRAVLVLVLPTPPIAPKAHKNSICCGCYTGKLHVHLAAFDPKMRSLHPVDQFFISHASSPSGTTASPAYRTRFTRRALCRTTWRGGRTTAAVAPWPSTPRSG